MRWIVLACGLIFCFSCRDRQDSKFNNVSSAIAHYWSEGEMIYRGECEFGIDPIKVGIAVAKEKCRHSLAALPRSSLIKIRKSFDRSEEVSLSRELGLELLVNEVKELQADKYFRKIALIDDLLSSETNEKLKSAQEIDFIDRIFHNRASFVLKEIFAGFDSTCAILSDSRKVCWGETVPGDRQVDEHGKPVVYSGVNSDPSRSVYFRSLAIGYRFFCALPVTEGVLCWGENLQGAMGRSKEGLARFSSKSVLSTNVNVKQIESGSNHTCALFSDGRVKCWGAIDGDERDPFIRTAEEAPFLKLSNIVKISSGGGMSCSLSASQEMLCWGEILGKRYRVEDKYDDQGVQDMSVGARHWCFVNQSKELECKGSATDGELGFRIGTDVDSVNIGEIKQLSLGLHYTCALLQSGKVKCWGLNRLGQLGLGHDQSVFDAESDEALLPISDVVQIATGTGHTCAYFKNFQLKCWGSNSNGQLGLARNITRYGVKPSETIEELPQALPWRRRDLE